jgi:predicted deacylase
MQNNKLNLYTNAFGESIFIPILRHKGQNSGPKIVLTCLSHGNEIIGAMTAIEVFNQAKSDQNFTGEIVVLSCMNQSGMENISRFFEADNQYDTNTQNLNRNFGGEQKTLTNLVTNKALAFIINEKPDLVIDCHSYALTSLVHIILDRPGGELERHIKQTAINSKIPFYLEYEAKTVQEQMLDKCLTNQLLLSQIPALTIELGPQIGFNIDQLEIAKKALHNLVLGTKFDLYAEQNCEIINSKDYHRQEIKNGLEFCGILKPLVGIGKFISKNTIIAEIYNLYGEKISEIKMPKKGYIIVWAMAGYTYPNLTIAVIV